MLQNCEQKCLSPGTNSNTNFLLLISIFSMFNPNSKLKSNRSNLHQKQMPYPEFLSRSLRLTDETNNSRKLSFRKVIHSSRQIAYHINYR